jgi:sporulation protein YqfC
MISNKCISITNFISIPGYDSSKVILKVKDNVMVINGENLNIKDIDGRSIIIVGKISSMEYSR